MTRATDSRPCPTPTTTAPPAASMYARPSASQIVEPSARTARGSAGSIERRKTGLVTDKSLRLSTRHATTAGRREPVVGEWAQDQRLEGLMDTSQQSSAPRDTLDHPLYRIAHLHGDHWVTLRPDQQHSPKADMPGGFSNGTVYRCTEC